MAYLQGQDWHTVVLGKSHKKNGEDKNEKNKLDQIFEEEIEKKHNISLNNSQLIQQGRKNANLTQKQLAQKLSIDSKIIQEYECGKSVPDYKIMCKIEKTLKIKLNKKKTQ